MGEDEASGASSGEKYAISCINPKSMLCFYLFAGSHPCPPAREDNNGIRL
jgi:hypothetical protein